MAIHRHLYFQYKKRNTNETTAFIGGRKAIGGRVKDLMTRWHVWGDRGFFFWYFFQFHLRSSSRHCRCHHSCGSVRPRGNGGYRSLGCGSLTVSARDLWDLPKTENIGQNRNRANIETLPLELELETRDQSDNSSWNFTGKSVGEVPTTGENKIQFF